MIMRTKEELNAIKKEYEELNAKLQGLTKEELIQVVGGEEPGPQCYITQMECETHLCGYMDRKYGNFLDQILDCPRCGNHTLKGIKIVWQG